MARMTEAEMMDELRKRGYVVKPYAAIDPTKGYVIKEGGTGRIFWRRGRLSKLTYEWEPGTEIAEVDLTKLKWEPI